MVRVRFTLKDGTQVERDYEPRYERNRQPYRQWSQSDFVIDVVPYDVSPNVASSVILFTNGRETTLRTDYYRKSRRRARHFRLPAALVTAYAQKESVRRFENRQWVGKLRLWELIVSGG